MSLMNLEARLFLKKLELRNFRNHESAEYNFHKKVILIIGDNAVGKSNLLSAIERISLGRLGYEEDKKSLRFGSAFFSVKAHYELDNKIFTYEYVSDAASGKRIQKLNDVKYSRQSEIRDFLLKTVCFKAKESLDIVRGTPTARRDWLNFNLCVCDARYAESLKLYEKTLAQRNKLLKTYLSASYGVKSEVNAELDVWDAKLSEYGSFLIRARKKFLDENSGKLSEHCEKISGRAENISFRYEPSISESSAKDDFSKENFEKILLKERKNDLIRGLTGIGPHRDDFTFLLDGIELKDYGSQGQQRSCALSACLLQTNIFKNIHGHSPILLLDDVTAELDLSRQKSLFENIPRDSQVFVTTTHIMDLSILPSQDFQIISLKNS